MFSSRRNDLLSFAAEDSFFADIVHDVVDFGVDISFSYTNRNGAYHPQGLATEHLNTPEKQAQFAQGFWQAQMRGDMKARIILPALGGKAAQAHLMLHELMHFYQDMLGMYFIPLQQKDVHPIMLDARSHISAILFNEAWAEVETLRTCWALNKKGKRTGWRGAVRSKDWRSLAKLYDEKLQAGVDEAVAAAAIFKAWYEGAHRGFYEAHALKSYDELVLRLKSEEENLRTLTFDDILARIPSEKLPKYMNMIDWGEQILTPNINLEQYPRAHSTDVIDIQCGVAPYIWKRLRGAEIAHADIPEQELKMNANVSGDGAVG